MNVIARLKDYNDALNDRYVADNETEVITVPKLVTVTTTLRCNYRCWMCYQPVFEGEIDWELVRKVEHVLSGVRTMQLFGGEPLMYSRIDDLLALGTDNGCDIEIITNGSLLTEKNRARVLDHRVGLVKVSMEAATQETYEFIRGGDIEKVLGNISALAEQRERLGRGPDLQINFVAMRNNIQELPDLVRMAGDKGVGKMLVLYVNCQGREDLARQSLYFHQELSDECMFKAVEAGRGSGVEVVVPGYFSDDFAKAHPIPQPDRTCHSPWKNCIINMDGSMEFCCGLTGNLGNLADKGFEDMWYGDKITSYRKVVNTDKQPECCRTCRVKARNFKDVSFHVRNGELAERMIAELGGGA